MKAQRAKQPHLSLIGWFVVSLGVLLVMLLSGCTSQGTFIVFVTPMPIEQPMAMPIPTSVPPVEKLAEEPVEAEAAAPDHLPRWEEGDCQFTTTLDETIECGYLIVREDRSQPEGGDSRRTVRLHVAIVKSRSPDPAPDPLIYLSGGPGQQTFPFIDNIVSRFTDVLEYRDLILFDQRGVGYSEPSLYCPEVAEWDLERVGQDLSREEVVTGNLVVNLACRDRLRQAGVNLAAYTSAASAADINDLRLARGYEQLNLYGVSYGTRLALTTMRDFGLEGAIRSVILDSVFPPQVDFYAELAPSAERIFTLLFDRCAADETCNTAYPDLETVYYDLVKRLENEPITVEIPSRSRPEPYMMSLNGDDLVDLLFNMLYDTNTFPLIPRLISQMDQGDFNSRTLQAWLRWQINSSEFRSLGLWYSVMCGEEAGFSTEEIVRQEGTEVQPSVKAYFIDVSVMSDFVTCEVWGAQNAGPVEREPVASDVPTLVLAGELDPITPPIWSQLAAETLSQAYYFEFPDVGHGVLNSRQCARDMTAAFLENPMVSPDLACLTELPAFEFVIE